MSSDLEYLNFEFFDSQLDTERDSFSSVFVGGGMAQPLGKRAFFTITVLYNLSYDDNEAPRPYDNPLVVRVGINAGF